MLWHLMTLTHTHTHTHNTFIEKKFFPIFFYSVGICVKRLPWIQWMAVDVTSGEVKAAKNMISSTSVRKTFSCTSRDSRWFIHFHFSMISINCVCRRRRWCSCSNIWHVADVPSLYSDFFLAIRRLSGANENSICIFCNQLIRLLSRVRRATAHRLNRRLRSRAKSKRRHARVRWETERERDQKSAATPNE